MKDKSLPYILLLPAALLCFNLWNKNRRLERNLEVETAKVRFMESPQNTQKYDSVDAKRTSKGSTVSFYKNGVLLGSTVTVVE